MFAIEPASPEPPEPPEELPPAAPAPADAPAAAAPAAAAPAAAAAAAAATDPATAAMSPIVWVIATTPCGEASGSNGAGGALSSPVAPIAGFGTGAPGTISGRLMPGSMIGGTEVGSLEGCGAA